MADFLRACPAALALALQGDVELWAADLFVLTLVDGASTFYWTSWEKDLTVSGQLYTSQNPWIKRSRWNVANTMEVPSLEVSLLALNAGFNGGASLKAQIHNGLLDGASFLLSRAFMPTPDDTTSLGAIDLFGGDVGSIDLTGSEAKLTIKGKNNRLDQMAPRNTYQIPCKHGFCDAGCTLNRVTFTASYVAGGTPTSTFIPWTGSPPGNATNYRSGTLTMTTGVASGESRSIAAADSSGITLDYPLYITPANGDHFTAFEGCDKTYNSGSGQSCTDRSNTQHYRGYEFIPPPTAAI